MDFDTPASRWMPLPKHCLNQGVTKTSDLQRLTMSSLRARAYSCKFYHDCASRSRDMVFTRFDLDDLEL